MKSQSKPPFVPIRAVPGNRLGRCLLPGLLGVAALGTATRPAHAGEWVLEKYSYTGLQKLFSTRYHGSPSTDGAYWYSKDFLISAEPKGEVLGSEGGVTFQGSWGVLPSYLNGTVPPDGSWEQYRNAKLGHAEFNGEVHAVLRWIRNPDENGNPDPNDKPSPSVWVWEEARAKIVRNHSRPNNNPAPNNETLYNEANPYTGELFSIPAMSCTLGSKDPVMTPNSKSQGGGVTYWGSVTDKAEAKNLFRVDSGGRDVIPLPATTFNVRVAATGKGWYELKSQIADIRCDYAAGIADFYIRVRPHHGGTFSSNTAAYAGAIDSTEHKADVQIGAFKSYLGTSLDGYPLSHLPAIQIIPPTAEGVQKGQAAAGTDKTGVAKLPTTPLEYDPEGVTDVKGEVIAGVMRSSDILRSAPYIGPVALGFKFGEFKPYHRATVDQVWTSVTWKKGVDGEKDWNQGDEFVQTDSDVKEWIWAQVAQDDADAIATHSLKFSAERLVVRVLDSLTQRIVTKIYTTNPQEINQHTGETDVVVVYEDDIDGDVSDYLGIPAATAAGDGVYKGELTIKKNQNFVVQSYRPGLRDLDVFHYRGE